MFTHNDHLKFFIDDKLYSDRTNYHQIYKIIYGAPLRSNIDSSSWQKENEKAVEIIYSHFNKNINILFSGGADSEIVANQFTLKNIHPKLFFILFSSGANKDEYAMAIKSANRLNLPLNVINFNVEHFFDSGRAKRIAQETQCSQMAYLIFFEIFKQLQEPFVLGGEVFLIKQDNKWLINFSENDDAAFIRFSIKNKIPIINEWFSFTPEMIYFFLTHPKMQNILNNPNIFRSTHSKNEVLLDLFPLVEHRTKSSSFRNCFINNSFYYHELRKSFQLSTGNLQGVYVDDFVNSVK